MLKPEQPLPVAAGAVSVDLDALLVDVTGKRAFLLHFLRKAFK